VGGLASLLFVPGAAAMAVVGGASVGVAAGMAAHMLTYKPAERGPNKMLQEI
jgi:hypothetical protein